VEAEVTEALVEAMVNRLDTAAAVATITVATKAEDIEEEDIEEEDIEEDTEAEGTEDTEAEDTEVDQAASLALKTSALYYR